MYSEYDDKIQNVPLLYLLIFKMICKKRTGRRDDLSVIQLVVKCRRIISDIDHGTVPFVHDDGKSIIRNHVL